MPDALPVYCNVRVTLLTTDGVVLDTRESHNVVTNIGRDWVAHLLGSSDYSQPDPAPHDKRKIAYMAVGCGGALQDGVGFAKNQNELVTVVALEDPVPMFMDGNNLPVYLKGVDYQQATSTYFPSNAKTVFVVDIAESEVSFVGNMAKTSNKVVGTDVPVSEAGLYLSGTNQNPINLHIPEADALFAYDIFTPIHVTPNTVLRIEWSIQC